MLAYSRNQFNSFVICSRFKIILRYLRLQRRDNRVLYTVYTEKEAGLETYKSMIRLVVYVSDRQNKQLNF